MISVKHQTSHGIKLAVGAEDLLIDFPDIESPINVKHQDLTYNARLLGILTSELNMSWDSVLFALLLLLAVLLVDTSLVIVVAESPLAGITLLLSSLMTTESSVALPPTTEPLPLLQESTSSSY